MYTIHIQYALLPNATLPLISLRQNDKKKLCALNFNLSFMTFIKKQWFLHENIMVYLEIPGDLRRALRRTPASQKVLLSDSGKK